MIISLDRYINTWKLTMFILKLGRSWRNDFTSRIFPLATRSKKYFWSSSSWGRKTPGICETRLSIDWLLGSKKMTLLQLTNIIEIFLLCCLGIGFRLVHVHRLLKNHQKLCLVALTNDRLKCKSFLWKKKNSVLTQRPEVFFACMIDRESNTFRNRSDRKTDDGIQDN